MQLKCDICDNKTSNPLVDRDENGSPLIVCQRCYARVRAYREYIKQPTVKQQYLSPSTKSKGNRYGVITSLKVYNTIKYKLEMYEDNELIETLIYYHRWDCIKCRERFLNNIPISIIPYKRVYSYNTKPKKSKKHYEYKAMYRRRKYKTYCLALDREKDVDFILELDCSKSKIEFIRQLYAFYKKNGGDQ